MGRSVRLDSDSTLLRAQMFMPDFQWIRAAGKAFDPKAAIDIGHGVERVPIHTNVGLHPAMDVTFHDQEAGAIREFDEPRSGSIERDVEFFQPVEVHRVVDRVAVDGSRI